MLSGCCFNVEPLARFARCLVDLLGAPLSLRGGAVLSVYSAVVLLGRLQARREEELLESLSRLERQLEAAKAEGETHARALAAAREEARGARAQALAASEGAEARVKQALAEGAAAQAQAGESAAAAASTKAAHASATRMWYVSQGVLCSEVLALERAASEAHDERACETAMWQLRLASERAEYARAREAVERERDVLRHQLEQSKSVVELLRGRLSGERSAHAADAQQRGADGRGGGGARTRRA
eukprot:3102129-Pleurochrysis_carterae.AAC.1